MAFERTKNFIKRFVLTTSKNTNGFLLLIAFGLIFAFVIKNWDIYVEDPYVVIGCFLLLIAIPIVSRFNVFQYKDIILKRSVEEDIAKASTAEIKKEKAQEEAIENEGHDTRNKKNIVAQHEDRVKLEQKILKTYSDEVGFEKEVKLLLDESDPIADIEYLIFDGSYRNRKRRYFIVTKASLTPMLRDRIYRYLRIIKDVSDRVYHNRIILRFAYIKRADDRFSDIDRFRNHFRNAIENGYLEIDVFDEKGNKQ